MSKVQQNSSKFQQVSEFQLTDCVISENAISAYKEDGVVCLRNAFSQDWLDVIEQGISQALTGASENLDIVKKSGDYGRFSVSSQAWKKVGPFREFIFESHIADLAWPFLESRYMSLFYDFLLIKEADSKNAATPWHQDHSYYPLRGTKVINCWVALDHIPQFTALRFYRGSHNAKIVYRAVNFEDEAADYLHVRKERLEPPDIDHDSNIEVLSTEMNPGDMLVWNSYIFHSAPGNTLDRRRAAFSTNWAGDDVTFDEVPALETYLDSKLKTGDRLISEKFPLVRGAIPQTAG
jgi:ectoine hydroxylase-related dioxygenase (phytanoyl-CoA dioxygenase family)